MQLSVSSENFMLVSFPLMNLITKILSLAIPQLVLNGPVLVPSYSSKYFVRLNESSYIPPLIGVFM